MAHVTLSIPDDIYKEMKRYPEIKWSEVVRRTIVSYLEEMKDTSSSIEIRSLLSESTLNRLKAVNSKKATTLHQKSAKEEWKRVRFLTQTS
jgi:hypothetical protein